MPLRASAQCRQTLARAPATTASNIWVTDRMLLDAFQRYSLSSVRSTGSEARCVHFNAGPLEHRRRAAKRRMTAVLPLSRLDVPAWFLPLAQDESPLKWWPPTPSSERHQKTSKHGVLNDIIAWLEDYPPPQPFIPPPTDEPIETSCQASNTSTETTLAHTTFSETISKSSRINDQLASVTAVDTQILPANEKAHGALDNASMPTIRVPQ